LKGIEKGGQRMAGEEMEGFLHTPSSPLHTFTCLLTLILINKETGQKLAQALEECT